MKHSVLAGLSILALSMSSALPAMAVEQPSVRVTQAVVNKQVDQNEIDRQELIEELDKRFEQQRQAIMAEMDAQLDQMHQEMVKVINERFEAAQQRLNR